MAVSEIDTVKVKEISKNIINAANEYDILINNLFGRFSKVTSITKEWVGNRAEEYFDYVLMDKNEFLSVGEKIREYGKKISSDADLMEEKIKYAKKIEKKG